MMRFFSNHDTERRLENEAAAARQTGYSRREIEQYRKLFTSFAKAKADYLSVGDIQELLRANGMPLSPDKLDKLRENIREILEQTPTSARGLQFNHFLLLIHDLRSMNFANINQNLILTDHE